MRSSGLRIGETLFPSVLCFLLFSGAARTLAATPKEHVELGSISSSTGKITDGESRILKPDLNKRFDPAMARFGSTVSSSKAPTAKTSFFGGLKAFGSSKPASQEKTFPSSAFQTPKSFSKKAEVRSFSSGSFSDTEPASETRSTANFSNSARTERTFGSVSAARESDLKTPSRFSEEYAGPEADKKKLRYTPSNGPLGGTSYGKVLSVDEVREILNKSK
jgi:hypothetical protein